VHKLNLPEINPSLKKENGKVWIFDIIRKKYIVLTPEDGFVSILPSLDHRLTYPRSLFKVEGSLPCIISSRRRSDILIFDRLVALDVIECKAPDIKLSQKAFYQVAGLQ